MSHTSSSLMRRGVGELKFTLLTIRGLEYLLYKDRLLSQEKQCASLCTVELEFTFLS